MNNLKNAALAGVCIIGSYAMNYAQPANYSYGRAITIPATSGIGASGDLTDFPMLFSFQHNDLRTQANGGKVRNANGYDIIFTSDCLTQLDHQIESYNASAGSYIAWVRVPTLSASEATTIYMYYSNPAVSVNPSATSVWDAGYKGVWHFNASVQDATANGNNLTDNPSNASSSVTGVIGTARNLNNNSDVASSNANGEYLRLPNSMVSSFNSFTFESWVSLDRTSTNWERIFDIGQNPTTNFFFTISTGTGGTGETRARITTGGNGGEQGPVVANAASPAGSWIHWAVVLDNASSTMTIYRNGSVYGSAAGTVTLKPSNLGATAANYVGRSQYTADHYIDARFDEMRISSVARNADWVLASYANQQSPATFFSVSAESGATTICALPIHLRSFAAAAVSHQVLVEWTTDGEWNNAFFTVQRSADATHWQDVAVVDGAGNSDRLIDYRAWDDRPLPGRSYYRLMQTDYDGYFTYSSIETVERQSLINVYPNPASDYCTIEAPADGMMTVQVVNALGQEMTVPMRREDNRIMVDTSSLHRGIYYLYLSYGGVRETRLISIQ